MDEAVAFNLAATALLVLVLLGVRAVAVQFVRRQEWASVTTARRWQVQIRNGVILLAAIGFVVIWVEQLRVAAVSLVALGAAFVLATKELIMCLSGAIARASGNSFTIGDRIEIAGIRGDVIDHSPLTTALLAVGPNHARTGQRIVFPNSLLLTNAVINENSGNEYLLHNMTIPVPAGQMGAASDVLLDAAVELTAGFIDQARAQMDVLAEEHSLPLPSVDPKVFVKLADASTVNLTLRFPAVVASKGDIEQEILERWLAFATASADDEEPDVAGVPEHETPGEV